MLRQRVLTAIALLALLLPAATWQSQWPFVALTMVFVAFAVWEWAQLQHYSFRDSVAMALVWTVAAAVGWALLQHGALGLLQTPVVVLLGWSAVCLVWALVLSRVLRQGPAGWARLPRGWRMAMGCIVLGASWVAVVDLHSRGLGVLLGALGTVWLSDIGAYFGGRLLGRRKLAPQISPAKSWEGVWAGAACAGVFAAAMTISGVGLYAAIATQIGWLAVMGLCVGIVAYGVAGDLFESVMKRSAGVKDSSGLLPGHGGVLDRLDALLPTMPFAMLVLSLSEVI
jgi:phosphatidate cytidylyltransferase